MLTCLIRITQFLRLLQRQLFSVRCMLVTLIVLFNLTVSSPAHAAIDTYVRRYLDAIEPVALDLDGQGKTKQFTGEELSVGKELFEENCLICHVGGATLPDPTISLSLDTLAGATPPRDTINGIVAFLRKPMTYDGTDESIWCRQVSESWMSQEQIENLAAFVLRAAQKAPGWGTENF